MHLWLSWCFKKLVWQPKIIFVMNRFIIIKIWLNLCFITQIMKLPVVFFAIHVDDILWSGSNNFERNNHKIAQLFHNWKRKFNAIPTSWFKSFWKQYEKHFFRSKWLHFQISKSSNADNSTSMPDEMRSTVGKLLWVSTKTRPDISFDVCQLAYPQLKMI